jgi:hypothetical protein
MHAYPPGTRQSYAAVQHCANVYVATAYGPAHPIHAQPMSNRPLPVVPPVLTYWLCYLAGDAWKLLLRLSYQRGYVLLDVPPP